MKPKHVKTLDWYHYNALFFMDHLLGRRFFQQIFGRNKAALFTKVDKYLKGTEDFTVHSIEELPADISDNDFLDLCYKSGKPIVFRGAAKNWPAIQNWSLDFFEKHHGDKIIELIDHQGMAPGQEKEIMTMKKYIHEIRNGSRKYLKFSDIVNEDVNLKSDFDLKWLRKLTNLPLSWGEDLKTFMGIGGTITPLHIGFSSVFFIQVTGQKKWHFYPPTDRMFLDAWTERGTAMFSDADPYKKEDPAFPLFKYAKHSTVVLNPGDVLWFPSYTWHQVENLTLSIGIRYGRPSIATSWKSSKLLTFLFFMITKPNLFSHLYNNVFRKGLVVKKLPNE